MEILKKLQCRIDDLPLHMDYEGQKCAERLFQGIIGVFAIVGFVWGYVCQQFSQTVFILAAGFVMSCLLTLPPWPMYRRNPLPWLKPRVCAEDISLSGSGKPDKLSENSGASAAVHKSASTKKSSKKNK